MKYTFSASLLLITILISISLLPPAYIADWGCERTNSD
jgi:hypothetical protein